MAGLHSPKLDVAGEAVGVVFGSQKRQCWLGPSGLAEPLSEPCKHALDISRRWHNPLEERCEKHLRAVFQKLVSAVQGSPQLFTEPIQTARAGCPVGGCLSSPGFQ